MRGRRMLHRVVETVEPWFFCAQLSSVDPEITVVVNVEILVAD